MKCKDVLEEVKSLPVNKVRGYSVVEKLSNCDDRYCPYNNQYDEEIFRILRQKKHEHSLEMLIDWQQDLQMRSVYFGLQ